MVAVARSPEAFAAHFWSRVDRRGPVECWQWTGATDRHGYGDLAKRGSAHRIAARLSGADITGRVVMHLCDNPPCCNPAHLVVGTQADNLADMRSKGRTNYRRRLSADQVARIHHRGSLGHRHSDIAAEAGVSRRLVGMILRGERYAAA